jgi:hypothetical protein
MTDISRPLTAEELSRILNISEFTIKKLARNKDLPCEYVSRQPRFTLERLFEYFKMLEGEVIT